MLAMTLAARFEPMGAGKAAAEPEPSARRDIRAQDLMRACLDRIAEREPQVHAFAHLAADAALEHARQLDAGALRGPLHGLPMTIKDILIIMI
jgi:Asp-tRNA(Asn)/Glu-tRNA(Gln) amidotransferase A subunit family amidase